MRFLIFSLVIVFSVAPIVTVTPAEAGICDPNLQRC